MKLIQVDAFTSTPFKGNPAAVCVLTKPQDETWMQAVAAEMNLSETAFVCPSQDPFSRVWQLRWFTPLVEVDLCGHATLATAHVLWSEGYVKPTDPAHFDTRSGRLTATMGRNGWITLDFPVKQAAAAEPPAGLLTALGIDKAVFVGRSAFDYLIEVGSADTVRQLSPDMGALTKVEARGIIVTSRGDGQPYDIVSRFFGPAVGIPEDPVTGSAHCTLASHWAEKLGQTTLHAYQASPRGGELQVTLAGERVQLSGQAVTVLKGELLGGRSADTPAEPKRETPKFGHWDED